jgi:DNA-binding winged helix-turn-helix (wHTH) protein/TolB-like protein
MSEQIRHYYEFGVYLLDAGKRVLLRSGEPVPMGAKVLETLLALIENRGLVVTKDELLKRVWGDTIVEEGGLARNVSILRKSLGEQPDDHQYIVTVPGRGYQFVADVRERRENDEARLPPELSKPTSRGSDSRARVAFWALCVFVLAGIVALAPGALSLLTAHRPTEATQPVINSVAVLPFENLSGDPAQEYFADRMTEVVTASLAPLPILRVVSRTSAMSLKGSRKPLPELARDLNVDALFEGSVQRQGTGLKIRVRLIHGPSDTHLWARTYQRNLAEMPKLEDDVARAVLEAVRMQIAAQESVRLR